MYDEKNTSERRGENSMERKQTRWMKFMGGNNIIYTLIVLFLIGATILLYSQLDFILQPIFTILSAVLTPLVISFILFYLLNPVVTFFEKRNVKRVWSIVALYALVIGLLAWLIIWLIPILQQQLEDLLQAIPDFFNTVTNFVNNLVGTLSLNQDQQDIVNEGLSYFENIEADFMDFLTQGFSGVGSVISSVTNAFVIMLMVPIILFFLLKDGSNFITGFMGKVPPGSRRDIASILRAIDTQVGSYIKGQILIAIVNGTLMFIGFTIIDLSYSGVLAVAGGFLSFIPYLGPTLTFIPAAIVALTDSFWTLGQLAIVWAVIQFIEGNLVEPNILGRRLNVHPVTIILILLIMGELLGLVGMILGVPIYAIIKVFITFMYGKFQERYNRYYGDKEGIYRTESLEEVYDLNETDK